MVFLFCPIKYIINKKILPNVSLSDEDAGMMDGLGETSLEHLGLEAALQEVLNLKAQHVIKLHLLLVQHSDPHETTEKCITWKKLGFMV